jgi:hypothetical protein
MIGIPVLKCYDLSHPLGKQMTMPAAAPKGLTIRTTEILDKTGKSVRGVEPDNEYVIAITVVATVAIKNISVGYNIKLASGSVVYGTSTAVQGQFVDLQVGEVTTCRFSFKPDLALGTYFLSSGAAETLTPEDEIHNYVMLDFVHDALPFVVVSTRDTGIADLKSALVSFEKLETI